MVRESMDALINRDPAKAQTVIMKDDEVDALKNQVIRELLTYMVGDVQTIERGLALILVSRHLERIADHAVNIAQDVIYMVQGRDVRHPRSREKATASK
jgi:phosphate transport system protein